MKGKFKEKLEDVKEFILNNKVKVILISSLILMLLVATIVYVMIINEDTDTVVEYGDFEEVTKVGALADEVLLDVNTEGLNEGEEVAIITDEETGKVTIVSTSDPKFEEKTAGKTFTKGKVTSDGVKVNKDDSNDTIINIATKPKEEQEENVIIEKPVEKPEEKPTDDNKDEGKEEPKPTEDKDEGNSGNTGSAGSSSGTTDKDENKPSKPADDDKDEKPSKPAEDDKDEKPSKDPTPTGEFIYKHNSTIENQIIAKIQSVIDNDEMCQEWGAKVAHGTAGHGNGFTYRGINAHDWRELINVSKTNYVYVQDEYCVYSDGSTVKTGMSLVYIYK